MEENKLEQTILNVENTIDALQRELISIVPAINGSLDRNEGFKTEVATEIQRLIQVIDAREKSLVDFVKTLAPYILTIKQYQEFTPIIRNAIDEAIAKMVKAEQSLLKSTEMIPKETLVKTKHSIDYKSLSIVAVLTILSCIALFSLGQVWLMKNQLDESKSYEMRYRMIGLELPQVANSVDSLYERDSEKFNAKVVKREEEQRLKWSIRQKQKELNELESQ
ncbi:hypothetical protein [Sphingobacterium hotanense]|uniref:Uncharacterized protein n=1 Tax=Sphingobacterium hotanense TaxID=649196 RepID=A0ABT7NSC7_9SPHI|nr:hypothetical protein [Sphingobacterium hotanense]MDM1050155.1 hypothetical protein [Sphingobacterium hotanense]